MTPLNPTHSLTIRNKQTQQSEELTTSCLLVNWLKSFRTSSAYATNTFWIVCRQKPSTSRPHFVNEFMKHIVKLRYLRRRFLS